MPYACAVATCPNTKTEKVVRGTSLIFHTFPKHDKNISKVWETKCKRKTINVKNARICSDHFIAADYERDLKSELLGLPSKKILKKDSVPSVFPSQDISTGSGKRPWTMQRLECNDRRELINMQLEKEKINVINTEDLNAELFTSTCETSCKMTSTTTSSSDELKCLQIKLSFQARQIAKMRLTLHRQRMEISRLKSLNGRLQHKINCDGKIEMTAAQEKKLKGVKRVNWGVEDIVRALTVRSVNPKAYETATITWKLPLPSVRTLQRWIGKFRCDEGLLIDVLNILKHKSESMDDFSKLCVLSFDEMSIDSTTIRDPTFDKICSHSKVQVIMIRGLCSSWKQPIYYKFDTNVTQDLLFEVISTVHDCGFIVVAIVSDLGTENRSLQRHLCVNQKNVTFKNPRDTSQPVHVIADVPHCLKNIRNHLLDNGVMLANGTIINKQTMYELVANNGTELMLAPYLTSSLIELTGSERMRVRPAAKLLSHHTAMLAKKVYPTKPEISDFFQILNDGFDLLNSRSIFYATSFKSAYGTFMEEQDTQLTRFEMLMSEIRFLTPKGNRKKALLPCQEGFLLSINALRGLKTFLLKKYDVKYILSSRLNQDCLENLFSRIRSAGGSNPHPTPPEFRFRLRLLILGSKTRAPKNSNTEEDQDDINYISADLLRNNPFPKPLSELQIIDEDLEENQKVSQEY